MADEALHGPIDFVLIEFPTDASLSPTAAALTRLLDAGVVRLYDIVVLRKSADGRVERLALGGPVQGTGSEFGAFSGAQSGLFDDQDIADAREILKPDSAAVLIAFENAWASEFVTAAHNAGGQVVASERISAQRLIDALDAAETAGT